MSGKHDHTLWDVKADLLKPQSQTEAKSVLSDLKTIGKDHPEVADLLAGESPLKDFLVAALSLAPYLREIANAHPPLLAAALSTPPAALLKDSITRARNAWKPDGEGREPAENEVMTRLRVAKREVSFITALADLTRIFDGRATTKWLSELAEAATGAAFDHLLLAGHSSGKLKLPDPGQPSRGSGVIVLGMGKLGAGELNYSSDIDLVVFYEPEAGIEIPADQQDLLLRPHHRLAGDGEVIRRVDDDRRPFGMLDTPAIASGGRERRRVGGFHMFANDLDSFGIGGLPSA